MAAVGWATLAAWKRRRSTGTGDPRCSPSRCRRSRSYTSSPSGTSEPVAVPSAHDATHRARKEPTLECDEMKALLLTNEYPPYTYGGAGVHVEFLSQELSHLMDVEVRCFGDQQVDAERLRVRGYEVDKAEFTAPGHLRPVFEAMA